MHRSQDTSRNRFVMDSKAGMEALDFDVIDQLVQMALDEDLGSGDITSNGTVPPGMLCRGRIIAKSASVIAGLFMVERVYAAVDSNVTVEKLVAEGARVARGTVVCQLEGPCRALLGGERVALNFLQRMCGIATLTARFVRAVRGTGASIMDTRKTTPGLRMLEKYAVRVGGGRNHRMGLYDAILVKENHIVAAGSVDEAIRRLRKEAPDRVLEVEVRSIEELVLAVEYGADIVLLDNMSVTEVEKAVKLVRGRVELEVSGGVTLKSVRQLALTGVSRISVGALTHSAPAADLSMLITPIKKGEK